MIGSDATFFGSRMGALDVWKINFLLSPCPDLPEQQSDHARERMGLGVGRKSQGARGSDGVPILGPLLSRNQENWNLFYSFPKLLFFLFTPAVAAVGYPTSTSIPVGT